MRAQGYKAAPVSLRGCILDVEVIVHVGDGPNHDHLHNQNVVDTPRLDTQVGAELLRAPSWAPARQCLVARVSEMPDVPTTRGTIFCPVVRDPGTGIR